jgi:hypothetical protein
MSTTSAQDKNFLHDVVGTRLLEDAIDWIKNNMEPEDVFTREQLDSWAEDNDYEHQNK